MSRRRRRQKWIATVRYRMRCAVIAGHSTGGLVSMRRRAGRMHAGRTVIQAVWWPAGTYWPHQVRAMRRAKRINTT